jgi:hypothetical protein
VIDRLDTAFERVADWSDNNAWWLVGLCAAIVAYICFGVVTR